MYGSETWARRKAEPDLIERTEMRMLRWMMGIHNESFYYLHDLKKKKFRNYYVAHAVVVYNDYYRVCDVFEIYYYPIFQKNHTH